MSPSTLLGLIEKHPADQTAVILPEQNLRITYRQLRDEVKSVAEALAAHGVRRGDRVGMALPNGLPVVVAFLAAGEVATAAPLNPGYKEEEFKFYLEDTNAKVLLLPPSGADDARRAAATCQVPVLSVDVTPAGHVTVEGKTGGQAYESPSPSDVALILHTSGSTGRPKRVPLSHANLSISAGNVAATYALSAKDVSLCVMPLFHVHGLVASTLATLATGGTVVVPSKFSPLSFWRTVRDTGATWYSAVPTIHQLLLARAEKGARPAGAENLRFIRSCSAALPPPVMAGLEEAFGAPVLEAYGMTEAAHQMASNPLPPAARKPGSVGPGTNVGISIRDEKGHVLAAGERGEVCISGPNVVKGYENNPEANATAFFGEWFRTGDQGMLDSEGYLSLTGRLKEMINRGGEKISPREIDEVLLAHPAIAEAVAFGAPHATWGEEVAAAVKLKDGASAKEADILAFCRERLADFKRPKQIFITDAIPRTATGKIQRRVVAQAFSTQPQ